MELMLPGAEGQTRCGLWRGLPTPYPQSDVMMVAIDRGGLQGRRGKPVESGFGMCGQTGVGCGTGRWVERNVEQEI